MFVELTGLVCLNSFVNSYVSSSSLAFSPYLLPHLKVRVLNPDTSNEGFDPC